MKFWVLFKIEYKSSILIFFLHQTQSDKIILLYISTASTIYFVKLILNYKNLNNFLYFASKWLEWWYNYFIIILEIFIDCTQSSDFTFVSKFCPSHCFLVQKYQEITVPWHHYVTPVKYHIVMPFEFLFWSHHQIPYHFLLFAYYLQKIWSILPLQTVFRLLHLTHLSMDLYVGCHTLLA